MSEDEWIAIAHAEGVMLEQSYVNEGDGGRETMPWTERAVQSRAWEAARKDEWTDLDRRLREVAKQRGELDVREAELLRQAEELQLWRAFGYATLLEYMERAMGYTPHTALERLRVARALVDLPLIAEALEGGVLKHSAVRELTRVASADTEAEWLAAAQGKSLREIEPLVAGRKQGSRPTDKPEPSLRRRRLTLELQPETYEMFRQAQTVLAELHGHRLSVEEMLVAMLRMVVEPAAAAIPAASSDTPPASAPSVGRPAYQLAIKTCPECKRSWQYGGGRDLEVGAAVVERARCDTEHLGSLDTALPERKTATLTKRVREHVFARDGYACTVPGCRRVTGLDIHHIHFQERGGGHEPSNLTLVCNLHHAALHDGKLTITGSAPDALQHSFPRGHATSGIEDLGPDLGPDVTEKDSDRTQLLLSHVGPPNDLSAKSHVEPLCNRALPHVELAPAHAFSPTRAPRREGGPAAR